MHLQKAANSFEWGKSTHIVPMEPETSVQTVSTSSLRRSSANACSCGSFSVRNPTRPAADVKPTIMRRTCCGEWDGACSSGDGDGDGDGDGW